MQASARVPGYPQVWARDSMITLLGAALISDDSIVRESLYQSVRTLASRQTALGQIPNNVDVRTGEADFQAYADSGLWFVVGTEVLSQLGDRAFAEQMYPTVQKVLQWYAYQDVDQTGLVSMVEGSDWQDLFAVRNKGFYVNVLYNLALQCGSHLADRLNDGAAADEYRQRAEASKAKINEHFWHRGTGDTARHLQFGSGGMSREHAKNFMLLREQRYLEHHPPLAERAYYLPYITFRDFGDWFDSLGNLLAILTGVANESQTNAIFDVIDEFKIADPYPIRCISPPLEVGHPDWRYYYLYGDLNLPHCYHNGGVWPFVGGFYVAALVKTGRHEAAERALAALAESNRIGENGQDWEFNEWLHGQTLAAQGMADQAWSAGMYVFAHEAVQRRSVPFLNA